MPLFNPVVLGVIGIVAAAVVVSAVVVSMQDDFAKEFVYESHAHRVDCPPYEPDARFRDDASDDERDTKDAKPARSTSPSASTTARPDAAAGLRIRRLEAPATAAPAPDVRAPIAPAVAAPSSAARTHTQTRSRSPSPARSDSHSVISGTTATSSSCSSSSGTGTTTSSRRNRRRSRRDHQPMVSYIPDDVPLSEEVTAQFQSINEEIRALLEKREALERQVHLDAVYEQSKLVESAFAESPATTAALAAEHASEDAGPAAALHPEDRDVLFGNEWAHGHAPLVPVPEDDARSVVSDFSLVSSVVSARSAHRDE
ncbi:hypothetical protein H9P43_000414 [Blastocladiella emersonii ATCC 22665]|nr:hypothetical protein H9P43_000414 [Blastocladiella emersonii ATCC 22665]